MDNIVVLNDEHGNEVEFEYLDLIEHNNEAYVVLLPVDEEADEVVILRYAEPRALLHALFAHRGHVDAGGEGA